MFKRLASVFLCLLCLSSVCYFNKTPIFSNYSPKLELYIGAPNSTAQIITVNSKEVPLLSNVCGEAFTTCKNTFKLNEFLQNFSAKIIFTESLEQGVCYYAYSNKIKYNQTVNDKKVNIQVFIGEQTVKVGSPIICGSF